MPKQLLSFWREFDGATLPLVHKKDLPTLRELRPDEIDLPASSLNDFLANGHSDATDARFHLSLLPQPYCGDLSKAEIILLTLNPGVGYTDYYAERHRRGFRSTLMRQIRQSFGSSETPFIFLDPQYCWHGGFVYWEHRLRKTVQRIAEHRFHGSYGSALADLARKLAVIQLVPYHSRTYRAPQRVTSLPSLQAARRFAHRVAAAAEAGDNKTIIVLRRMKDWGIQSECPRIVVYNGPECRRANLDPSSKGGKAILKHYGLRASG